MLILYLFLELKTIKKTLKLIKCYCYGKSLVIQHPSYAFSIIELNILSFERERGEIMDKYIRRAYQRMNQMSFGGQALAWFLSIRLSDLVLKK